MAKKDGTDPVVNRCMLVLGASLLCCINPAAVLARAPDPIPPQAVWMSDASALALLPDALLRRRGLQLVLHRSSRQLLVLDHGRLRLRVPAAVGTDGWETPLGEHSVLSKTVDPTWKHPSTGALVAPGGRNPLGSRWIAFHQDCSHPGGWDGEKVVQVTGCSHVGLHGTPHRWTVGRAVSHGCVRLYDEDIRTVFDLVRVGTPVVVLP